jgi:hypothetical protein
VTQQNNTTPTPKHARNTDNAPRNANKSDTPPDLAHTPMTRHHTDHPYHPTAPTTPHTKTMLKEAQQHPPDLSSSTNRRINNQKEQRTKRDGKNIDKFLK